jgi:hypothetical protein
MMATNQTDAGNAVASVVLIPAGDGAMTI